MADPITIGLAGVSILGGLLGGGDKGGVPIETMFAKYGITPKYVYAGGTKMADEASLNALKKAIADDQTMTQNAKTALLDNYKNLTDPNSKFYTDIASKLLGAQNQKTASVGTLLGVGLASGVPYQVASKYADQQRKAIEQQNRESVNNTMGGLFLQGQLNQLQENQANRMFQSNMYDKQSSQSMQNQWLTMGFGLLGNELGSNKTAPNYNTPDNPYFKPFWANTGQKIGMAVAGYGG